MVVLTAIAAPVALAFETLLRELVLPPEFEQVRTLLRSPLTPVAWALAAAAGLAAVAGVAWQRRLSERAVAKLPEAQRAGVAAERARLGAFLLAASVPQLPAIFATVSFMFGAALPPVLVAIAVSTAAVLLQAARV